MTSISHEIDEERESKEAILLLAGWERLSFDMRWRSITSTRFHAGKTAPPHWTPPPGGFYWRRPANTRIVPGELDPPSQWHSINVAWRIYVRTQQIADDLAERASAREA